MKRRRKGGGGRGEGEREGGLSISMLELHKTVGSFISVYHPHHVPFSEIGLLHMTLNK